MKISRDFKNHIIALGMAIIATVITSRFLTDTIIYSLFSLKLYAIEQESEEGFHNANGFITWTENNVSYYNEIFDDKAYFIKTNDVANYLYHAGFSITGKLFRFIAILAVIAIFVYSLLLEVKILKFLLRPLRRYLRRRKRKFKVVTNQPKTV